MPIPYTISTGHVVGIRKGKEEHGNLPDSW